jgi:hypothetical protein
MEDRTPMPGYRVASGAPPGQARTSLGKDIAMSGYLSWIRRKEICPFPNLQHLARWRPRGTLRPSPNDASSSIPALGICILSYRAAWAGARSLTRSVGGRLYPGIGVLLSTDSFSFLLANSMLSCGSVRFPQFPRQARFLLLGCGSGDNPRSLRHITGN